MAKYDIVFVGYPVWWHATPAPINTFLESYDLTGKVIIPFCTSGESDIDETMPTFLDSCENLAVYGERRISGASEVDAWLSELGFHKKSEQSTEKYNNIEDTKPTETTGTFKKTVTETQSVETTDNESNILIAYFTWSGNTTEMAEFIAEQTDADLFEIVPQNPYPTVYEECGDVAKIERDENLRPEIADLPESLDEYDTIFIGYPIWWHTAPMIIGTFLESYDLTDVEIYPFTQSASMDTEQFENSMEFVRQNAAGANIHDGLFTDYSNTDEIKTYLTENGFETN